MAENEKVPIEFRLDGLELLGKRITERTEMKVYKSTDFHFVINTQVKVNAEKKLVAIVTDINVSDVMDKNIELAFVKVASAFEIINFDQLVKLEKNSNLYRVHPFLERLLQTLNLGTCRGVLFSELSGTYLNKAFLPVVNIDFPPLPGIEWENFPVSEE